MVFKGTPNRTSLDVNRDFDKIGAKLQRLHQRREHRLLRGHPAGVPAASGDILADILRGPSLRGDDFQMEERRSSSKRSACTTISRCGAPTTTPKKTFFAEHPLGNSILGDRREHAGLQREQMQAYYDRRYVAPNITLAVAGNLRPGPTWSPWPRALRSLPGGEAPRQGVRPAPATQAEQAIPRAKITQEACLCAVARSRRRRHAPLRRDTLAMVIGDDSSSQLSLRRWSTGPGRVGRHESFHDYEGAGAYYTSLSCEPDKTNSNLAIVRKILAEVQAKGITDAELSQAKSKVLSRVVRRQRKAMGECRPWA